MNRNEHTKDTKCCQHLKKGLLYYKGLLIFLNIARNGWYKTMFAFNLFCAFCTIVLYCNLIHTYAHWNSRWMTATRISVTFSILIAVWFIFKICIRITEVCSQLLRNWNFESTCAPGSKSKFWHESIVALRVIQIPCANFSVTKAFVREYLYQTNVVSINTLLIGSFY